MTSNSIKLTSPDHIAITGGLGFIGSNYARRLLARGQRVSLIDNLSRPGSDINLELLRKDFPATSFEFHKIDIRDGDTLKGVLKEADAIIHLAGQVAVTTSVTNPVEDFEINARGTLNVLEAARASNRFPFVLYSSTNKVYGELHQIKIAEAATRYYYPELPEGVSEDFPLDFHSPYGCSKGTGDQYVRDYARIYDIPTAVIRQSCIYGRYQFGIGDQGWVAWFLLQAFLGRTLKVFGDGKQVRDLLYVEDLLDGYDLALSRSKDIAGEIFNFGGGKNFTLSIWHEFRSLIAENFGKDPAVQMFDWRPGDQKCFISDISRAKRLLGWEPKTSIQVGVSAVADWIKNNEHLFRDPRLAKLL